MENEKTKTPFTSGGYPASILELRDKDKIIGKILLSECQKNKKDINKEKVILNEGNIFLGHYPELAKAQIKVGIEGSKNGLTVKELFHFTKDKCIWTEGWDYGNNVNIFLTLDYYLVFANNWIRILDREPVKFHRKCLSIPFVGHVD